MAIEELRNGISGTKTETSNGSASAAGTGRDPELARAEAEIARTRVRVAGNILALRREVARRADWREWVRQRPLEFVAGAFLFGLLIGGRHAATARRRADGR